eukprot:5215598-Lingulodinium_polyedra.AAC.1
MGSECESFVEVPDGVDGAEVEWFPDLDFAPVLPEVPDNATFSQAVAPVDQAVDDGSVIPQAVEVVTKVALRAANVFRARLGFQMVLCSWPQR